MREQFERTLNSLKKNNMQPFFAETREEALEIIKGLIKKGATVAHGGSVTLDEIGIENLLNCGDYIYFDRTSPDLSAEGRAKMMKKALTAEVYLSSANAVTENGELYNVDGNGNRIAALAYGPESVIVTVGKNKIVKDLSEAVKRVKTIAAPLNAKRLNISTYCSEKGNCASFAFGKENEICAGCESETRICSTALVSGHQLLKNRIKVIIVNEDLGY